jgi:hypothetical protein
MSREQEEKSLSTADFVAATETPAPDRHADNTSQDAPSDAMIARGEPSEPRNAREASEPRDQAESLAALFTPDVAEDFQSRWDAVQIGFVDDPKEAVRQADELVAQVMKSLAESFAAERARFDSQLDESDSGSTENMRVALRRYRSFFQRLLSL